MKKLLIALLLTLMAFVIFIPALAETFEAPLPEEAAVEATVIKEPASDPSQGPWTWAYLATIAGAAAATLLIVQYAKVPLDKVWKIPTRLFVYVIALVILTAATAFTTGLTPDIFLLCVLNAFVVALTAFGAYEITFARSDKT